MKKNLVLLTTLVSLSFVCAAENDGDLTPMPGSPVSYEPSTIKAAPHSSLAVALPTGPIVLTPKERTAAWALFKGQQYNPRDLPFKVMTKADEQKALSARQERSLSVLFNAIQSAIEKARDLSDATDVEKRMASVAERFKHLTTNAEDNSFEARYDRQEQALFKELHKTLTTRLQALRAGTTVLVTKTGSDVTTEDISSL